MSVVHRLYDGLQSLVSGLGTDRDKASTLSRTLNQFTDAHAYAAYETSALARNIIDLPALDSCREWRDWQATKDQIELIEGEESRLQLRTKVLQARKWARLFGGSALLIGTGEMNLSTPLNVDRIALGGLKYVTVIGKDSLSAGELESDPANEFFGKPKVYTITGANGRSAEVHPSRLAIFTGNERPNTALYATDGFGASVLASVIDDVNRADATAANIASLVFEAKIDIIKVPELSNRLSDPTFEAMMRTRFSLAATMKGINGMMVLDSLEDYDQKTANFSNLTDILMSFMQLVAGAARIPATLLLGQAPAGMNATGEGDYKNYLDRIGSEQTLYMTPALYRLDECLIRSALGPRDPDVFYTWAPLWQQSEKERAETFKLYADGARAIIGTASGQEIITREAVSVGLTNRLIEDGTFPGLDTAIEDYGKIEEQEPSEEEIAAMAANSAPVDPKLTAGNSEPKDDFA